MYFSWAELYEIQVQRLLGHTFDHELKFKRAEEHLLNLDYFTRRWIYFEQHCRIRYERDADTGLIVALATSDQPPINPISLWLGEALHNMRSGLDNLAFALAVANHAPGQLPDDIAKASEFPIFGDEDSGGRPNRGHDVFHELDRRGDPKRGSGLYKIRGMAGGAQNVIEGLQPYYRGNAFRDHPLWRIHELDNFNKHRLLHTTVAHSHATSIDDLKSFNYRIGGDGSWESIEGPIGTDTPIARIDARPIDPELEMHVEIEPQLRIAFSDSAPCMQHVPAAEALAESFVYIVTNVLAPLTAFL
jgi:hypothetical protein